MFSDQPSKHFLHVGHYGIQIEDLWLQYLPATKRQKLTGQRSRPIAGFLYLLEIAEQRIFSLQPSHCQRAEAVDDCKQVVKIMSNAAGQLAHAFEFLRLP